MGIMANEEMKNYEDEIIDPQDVIVTLELEDGGPVDCMIVTIFDMEYEGSLKDYIALLELDPETEEPGEDSEILLYRYLEDEDGNPDVVYIESDAEFSAVCEEFDRLTAEMDE